MIDGKKKGCLCDIHFVFESGKTGKELIYSKDMDEALEEVERRHGKVNITYKEEW